MLAAADARAATTCAPGKVHDKHGHCVVPVRHKQAASAISGATGAAPTAAVAATQAGQPVTVAAPMATATRDTRSDNIVVTGTLFRDPNLRSASPITRITSKELQQRGISTITDALQLLASNGSGNLTNAFSSNGAFAVGASAPSLRGLMTSSTLVLMDSMRLSYYPLADDGSRNFVDTNWIPQSITQTIDVQQDGGSATYGADAVAGVINIITRDQIKGFEGTAEGGVAQGGYGGHQRLAATYGWGDLHRDGYNFYINGEYQNDDQVSNSQLPYPYNSSDLTGIGGGNGDANVLSGGNITNFGQTPSVVAQAVDSSGNAVSGYKLLNTTTGCGSVGKQVSGYVAGTPTGSVSTTCQYDKIHDYGTVQPYDRRIETTAHLTVNLGSRATLTSMFTYSQNQATVIGYTGPSVFSGNTQSELGTSVGVLAPAVLPNGQLNPNDPFAAQGLSAQLYGLLDEPTTTTEFSQNYRGSMHLTGWQPSSWGGDWSYDTSFVGMDTTLRTTNTGYINIADLNYAILNGTYNFVNQAANSQAARDAIAPPQTSDSTTEEYSWQASLSKPLFKLPGGMLNLAIGTNIRYESLDTPNNNPTGATVEDQYESINPVTANGHRYVYSGYFEVNAPIVKMLDADFQGRYDAYSEGFSHFSPKIGVNFKPTPKFTLRGTWSEGFQVPSFYETSGTTIGYTNYAPTNSAFIAQHANADGSPNSYAQAYSLGGETVGNPNLKPQTNNTFTGGPIFHPTSWLTLGADYYYIREKNVIVANPVPTQEVAAAYEALNTNKTVNIDGDTVIPDVADPQNPSGSRRAGIIESGYINANSLTTDGVDLSMTVTHRLPGVLHDIMWFSNGTATWVHRFNEDIPGVGIERFAGTEGPWEITSASGTPRWKANWQNTFTYKKLSTTFTAYYTSGYKSESEDVSGPGTAGNCDYALSSDTSSFYPTQCHVKAFWELDMSLNYQFNPHLGAYLNIYNLNGAKAPYDFGTYGAYLYNSSWAQNGVLGRSFRFGVNAKF